MFTMYKWIYLDLGGICYVRVGMLRLRWWKTCLLCNSGYIEA